MRTVARVAWPEKGNRSVTGLPDSLSGSAERQRSPGRGENHCFQKPRGPRLRVQRIVMRLAVPRPKFAALIDPFLTFRPSQYPEHVEILRLRYGRIGAMLEWIDLYCWFAQPIFNTFVKSAQLMWPFILFYGGTSESARDKAFSIVVVPGRTPPRYYRCARKIDMLFPVVRKGVTVQLKVYLVFRIVGRWCVTQLSNWPDFGTPKVEDGLRISK